MDVGAQTCIILRLATKLRIAFSTKLRIAFSNVAEPTDLLNYVNQLILPRSCTLI